MLTFSRHEGAGGCPILPLRRTAYTTGLSLHVQRYQLSPSRQTKSLRVNVDLMNAVRVRRFDGKWGVAGLVSRILSGGGSLFVCVFVHPSGVFVLP